MKKKKKKKKKMMFEATTGTANKPEKNRKHSSKGKMKRSYLRMMNLETRL